MSTEQVDRIYKVTDKAIYGFFKEHRFLSNFHQCDIFDGTLTYPSTEAAYQAYKTVIEKERRSFLTMTAAEAKKAGREVTLRSDWDTIKNGVMVASNEIKYRDHPDLRKKLLATGNKILVESNWWGDVYWGQCNGVGENKLGLILMEIRSRL